MRWAVVEKGTTEPLRGNDEWFVFDSQIEAFKKMRSWRDATGLPLRVVRYSEEFKPETSGT